MDKTNNKTSLLVSSQVPEFVRRDHPRFIEFLEAYYSFTEQDGNVSYVTKKFTNFFDVDRLAEDLAADMAHHGGVLPPEEMYHAVFQAGLYNTYLKNFPTNTASDLNNVLKFSFDFLRARGSQKSTRYLTRILFGKDSDVYYPQQNILKASDGKWFVEKSINIRDIAVNNVANSTAFGRYVNTTINGLTSNAYAIVEASDQYYDAGSLITELKVSSVTRDFINGETIVATIEDEGQYKRLSANLYSGIVASITLTSPGSGYIEGASVPVIPVATEIGVPANGSGAQVIISKVIKSRIEGTIRKVDIQFPGAGYVKNDLLLFTGGGGSGANANVFSVLDDGTYHEPYFYIIGSRISDVQDDIIYDPNNNVHIGYAYSNLANIYVNTSNLLINVAAGTLVQNVELDFWSGNSNVYFELGDLITPLDIHGSPIGDQIITGFDKQSANITIRPGITSAGIFENPFRIIKKPNVNNMIANSSNIWRYGPAGPIVSTAMINPGSGYIEIPTVSVKSNTSIRDLGILGRMDIYDGGRNYANGEFITFDNPAGTYGVGANAIVTSVDANGTITQVNFRSLDGMLPGGYGYRDDMKPTVNVHTTSGNGANIMVTALLASDAELTARSNAVGSIVSLKIVSGGVGYETNPIIDLATQGDGTAQAFANIVTGVYSYPGRYIDQSGQLSSYMFLENRDYYQNFSYVVQISESIKNYRKAFNDLIHPAGTKMYGQYLFQDNNESNRDLIMVIEPDIGLEDNTANIIVNLFSGDYYDGVLETQSNRTIWVNTANTDHKANVQNAALYYHGGLSLDGTTTNVMYDYSNTSNLWAIQDKYGAYYYGGGMYMDGNNDVIVLPHNDTMNVSNTLSVVAWFELANTKTNSVKNFVYKVAGNKGYNFYVNNKTVEVDLSPVAANNKLVLTTNQTSGRWTMAAFTYDGSTIRGYLNGSLVNTSTGVANAFSDSVGHMYIGNSNTGNVMYGKIGLIQVYNAALSNNDIANHFNEYRGRYGI
jgi:hypothetical protein